MTRQQKIPLCWSLAPSVTAMTLPIIQSPATTSVIVNPYTRKSTSMNDDLGSEPSVFIGGAEAARRKARQKRRHQPATQIQRPGQEQSASSSKKGSAAPHHGKPPIELPHKMNSFERFFAALLRSPVNDFASAADFSIVTATKSSLTLWSTICGRVGIPIPTRPLEPCYQHDFTNHFNMRAALVLEEARHVISTSVQQAVKNGNHRPARSHGKSSSSSFQVMAHIVEPCNSYNHVRITFSRHQNFTPAELYNIRPGAIVQCTTSTDHRGSPSDPLILGVVVSGNRETIMASKCFLCLFFKSEDWTGKDDCVFTVTIVTQLVTQLRCFEAMTMPQHDKSIGFMHSLMGNKSAVHTRFNSDDSCDPTEIVPAACPYPLAAVTPSPRAVGAGEFFSAESSCFRIPKLNAVQEDAATSYLRSAPNTITLVIGPPGTGKTTLLVAIMCRYVTEAIDRGEECRIMVSAPTNQAVSVLATRFLAAIKKDAPTFCKTILVGDADKLFGDERSRDCENLDSDSARLRSIFLYKWIPTVIEGYERIRDHCSQSFASEARTQSLLQLSENLEQRLTRSLQHLSSDVIKWTAKITLLMKSLQDNSGSSTHRTAIVTTVRLLLNFLKEIPTDVVWTGLLLTANVIFCTLASAGGAVLRKTCRIDDLIVDEAAAATEPELCIPFHLKPKRLLVVGDPQQLPATVLSRRAVDLGLAKSLHERLLHECQFEHVMLNVQYRMSCQISSFPSARFYKSQIGNGPNVAGPLYQNGARLLCQLPYCFLQVEGTEEQGYGGSYCNRLEANKVADLVVELQQIAQRESADPSSWHVADRVRVITFYQAQVSLIKRCLHDRGLGNKITVATVDSSQGCEADVVLLSFVRSPAEWTGRPTAGFLTDDRRMNVALTRAKYQLICVGNVYCFERMMGDGTETIHGLAQDVTKRGLVLADCSSHDIARERLDRFYSLDTSSISKRCRSAY